MTLKESNFDCKLAIKPTHPRAHLTPYDGTYTFFPDDFTYAIRHDSSEKARNKHYALPVSVISLRYPTATTSEQHAGRTNFHNKVPSHQL